MHAIHSTNDIDKTLAFYQSVFGLAGQVRPFQNTGPQILTAQEQAPPNPTNKTGVTTRPARRCESR